MSERNRAFVQEFLSEMQRRGGFPKNSTTRQWFRKNYGGIRTNTVSEARNGAYVPERIATGILEMLIRDGDRPAFMQGRIALADFLAKRGIPSVTLDRLEPILSHVCTPPVAGITKSPRTRRSPIDYIKLGAAAIAGLGIQYMLKSVQGCRTAEDIAAVVDWLYVRVGRSRAEAGGQIGPDAARLLARRLMKIGLNEYSVRATEWHRVNPWTVVLAKKKHEIVGGSIVLPVTEAAYEEVRCGVRPSYDCRASEIAVPANVKVVAA